MNKRNYLILIVIGLLLASVLLVGCKTTTTTVTNTVSATTTKTATATVTPIELKWTTQAPPTHLSVADSVGYLATEMEKRSNGRVTVKVFWANSLLSNAESYDGIIKGVADIGDIPTTYITGRFPAAAIAELPIGYRNVWAMSKALLDWAEHFKPKEFDETVLLGVNAPAAFVIGTVKKPVRTLEDMKGLNLRVTGGMQTELIKRLGGVPNALPLGEVMGALTKAVVEGMYLPVETYPQMGFGDIINYVTDTRDFTAGNFIGVFVSKNTLNKLTPEDQQTLKELALGFMDMRSKITDTDDAKGWDTFSAMPGKEIITLSTAEMDKFKAAIAPLIDTYINDVTAKGMPGADYVKYLQERVAYWSTQIPK
jgi:TRAP-type C4-dicarboxylate transport system substrate-binding protein